MLLSKTFNYLAPNGKLEITTFKISPSGLKRANVPDKLVNAYDLANDRLQVLAGLEKRSAKEEQESKQYSAERNAALEAIETFLSEQEMRQFGVVDMKLIEALLESDITAYQIEKDTGIMRAAISRYRNDIDSVLNMTIQTGIKLTRYARAKLT